MTTLSEKPQPLSQQLLEREQHARDEARGRGMLRRLQRAKETECSPMPMLGQLLPRVDVRAHNPKRAEVVSAWERLLPPMYRLHVQIESFTAGVMRISTANVEIYEETIDLLGAGLNQAMLAAADAAGLRRIEVIKPNQGGYR